ncbi:MAG: efflux RND transporter periplasmic adaptor subunit [Thermoanaerobaculia bacterium]
MTRHRKNSAVKIVSLAVIAGLAGGYFWLRAGMAATEPAPVTDQVRRQTLDQTVLATGVIRPVVGAEIDVGSRVSGIVGSLPVKVGDRVDRGDLLARIDPTEFEAQVAQAEADLALSRAQLAMAASSHERAAALSLAGIVSEFELESATRDLEVARARVDLERARVNSAQIQLAYTEIRAPVQGVIADVTTREGETVAASFAAPTFVTIVDLDRLEVQAYVDETDIGQIFVGQQATFSVDTYPEADFAARVTAVNPKAELQNGVVNYVVRLAFELPDALVLRPEMTAHVRLVVEERSDVLTVPRRAIRRDQGQQFVLVSRNGAWVDQRIEPGWRTDSRVEVRQGLSENETVRLNEE